ncbi:hypothetical protein M413DRAFT_351239 [Hebeloma cylindrosporum]|uniref:Uncharacterized protein n=1 Tax=Hebeloma cylindrosporum TaxID=76867 RepID=A0A0C3BT70_HEBCY|nr:hypothetical protein M413DRAFT_351239 [Hebeloma cylindrosporum h7]
MSLMIRGGQINHLSTISNQLPGLPTLPAQPTMTFPHSPCHYHVPPVVTMTTSR